MGRSKKLAGFYRSKVNKWDIISWYEYDIIVSTESKLEQRMSVMTMISYEFMASIPLVDF